MNRILIAYTTNSGSTEEIATAIGEELGKAGAQVNVRRLEEVTDIEPYEVVIVGAPLILGWHRSAVKFLRKHQQALSQKKVAYFCTGMSLTQTDETQIESTPVFIDPELVKPPKNPGRLSLKERYATISNYIRPIVRTAPSIKPVSVAIFGGKLELFRLKLFQMLFVMIIIQAQPGDLRNWSAIREWAANIRFA